MIKEDKITEIINSCVKEYDIPRRVFETLRHCVNTNDEEGMQMMIFVINRSIINLLKEKQEINLSHIETLKKYMNINHIN